MENRNNKGFTLAELLIVVAIIAVLTAVAIPVFGNSLEKAKESTDLANLRAAYAECANEALLNTGNYYAEVEMTQANPGFIDSTAKVGSVLVSSEAVLTAAVKGTSVFVKVTQDGAISFVSTEPAETGWNNVHTSSNS